MVQISIATAPTEPTLARGFSSLKCLGLGILRGAHGPLYSGLSIIGGYHLPL